MKHEKIMVYGIVLITLVAIIEQFATDCYLPAFPAIAQSFSTSSAAVQLSLSFFLGGEALAQPFFGFLSDYYGRRIMLLSGVILFAFSSLICWFAPSIGVFLVGRILQGFGVGSGIVLARAMAKDIFASEEEFSQMASLISIVIIIIPLLSPISGGYIQHHAGWRTIFMLITLAAFGLSILMFFFLPETFPKEKRHAGSFHSMLPAYLELLRSKVFLVNVMISSLVSAAATIYITITPFLFTHALKVTSIVLGWSMAAVSLGVAIGCAANAKLVKIMGTDKLIKIGMIVLIVPIIIMLLIGLEGSINLWVIILPMLFATTAIGLITPNTASKALTPFPKIAGGASAIFGSIQFGIFAVASAVAATVHTKTQVPLALLILAPLILVVLVMVIFKEKIKKVKPA